MKRIYVLLYTRISIYGDLHPDWDTNRKPECAPSLSGARRTHFEGLDTCRCLPVRLKSKVAESIQDFQQMLRFQIRGTVAVFLYTWKLYFLPVLISSWILPSVHLTITALTSSFDQNTWAYFLINKCIDDVYKQTLINVETDENVHII